MFEVVARPVHASVELLPPTSAPQPEPEKGPLKERVVVPTPVTPAPPFEKRSWLAERLVVVESPQYVMVELEPPTSAPKVAGILNGPETLNVEVATEVK